LSPPHTGDLRSVRQIVKEALLTIDCHPVEQTNFEPDWRTVEGMLRAKIEGCQALIHIAGMRFGAEPDPASLPSNVPRRSYTQMEYEIGRRLQEERGEEGFRVYSFICPEDFPYDQGAARETEEKADLQRQHRCRLMDMPQLYERPKTPADFQTRIHALKEEVIALRREQVEVKNEIVAAHRFGVRAFAAVILSISLIGGGLWWVNHRQESLIVAQRMDAPALRARLTEASDRTLEADLASASKETRWAERQRLAEAAKADHQSRIARINDIAIRLAELSADSSSSPILIEMTRVLEAEGVDSALAYIETQRKNVIAEVLAIRNAERQRIRQKLEPLLQAAVIQGSKGLNNEARAAFRELTELQPDWPEALSAYAWFLYDRSIHEQSYGTLATAVAFAEECHELAQRLVALDANRLSSQFILSASLVMLGKLAVAQGDFATVVERATESQAICKRLASSDPTNASWQRVHSSSLNLLGDVARSTGDFPSAVKRYLESLFILEILAAKDPANAELQFARSVSLEKLGELAFVQKDWPNSERHHTKSLAIRKQLAASDPSNSVWQHALSVSLNKLGELAIAQGDPSRAERILAESHAVFEHLAASDPSNAGWQRDLSVSLNKLGELAIAQGDHSSAERTFAQSLAIRKNLAASDPSNSEWQRDLSVSLNKLGELAIAQGDLPSAARRYSESLAIVERLTSVSPTNTDWKRDLWLSQIRLGDLAVAQKDWPSAAQHFDEALGIAERLANSTSSHREWQSDLWISYMKVGHTARKMGDLKQALESLEEGLAVALPLAEQESNTLGSYNLACYFSLRFLAHFLKYEDPDSHQKKEREYLLAETLKSLKEVVDKDIATEADIRRDIDFEHLVNLPEFEKLFDK